MMKMVLLQVVGMKKKSLMPGTMTVYSGMTRSQHSSYAEVTSDKVEASIGSSEKYYFFKLISFKLASLH